MKNKIKIKADNKKYISHLIRYLRYVFDIESSVLEEKRILKNFIIFIDEDVEIDENWLGLFNNYSGLKIIILGLTRESSGAYVNILDLSHLKKNIQSVINRKEKPGISPFFRIKKVNHRIQSLFKGHGEESLVDKLNKTIHLLGNGPKLLKGNILSWSEYKNTYFGPGLENWTIFKKQFQKSYMYLKVCGFEEELTLIETNINLFQDYIKKLRTLDKVELIEMDGEIIAVNIDYINQIKHILTGIQRKINALYYD